MDADFPSVRQNGCRGWYRGSSDGSLPLGCKGEVRDYRTARIAWKSYWTSAGVLSNDPDATAIERLTLLSDSLTTVMSETTRVALTIEQLVSDDEEASGGVHISVDLVKLAARFNTSIDMPVHRDLAVLNAVDLLSDSRREIGPD